MQNSEWKFLCFSKTTNKNYYYCNNCGFIVSNRAFKCEKCKHQMFKPENKLLIKI